MVIRQLVLYGLLLTIGVLYNAVFLFDAINCNFNNSNTSSIAFIASSFHPLPLLFHPLTLQIFIYPIYLFKISSLNTKYSNAINPPSRVHKK